VWNAQRRNKHPQTIPITCKQCLPEEGGNKPSEDVDRAHCKPGRQWRWKEGQSQELPRYLGLAPVRMVLADTGSRQFAREQTHVSGKQKPLLPGHVAQDPFLDRLCFGSCVRDPHIAM